MLNPGKLYNYIIVNTSIHINVDFIFRKPKIKGLKWPRVSRDPKDKLNFVHFISPDNIVVEEADEIGHRSFWDSLPIKENNLLVSVKDEL